MTINDLSSISLLDKIRVDKGITELRNFFSTLLKNNRQEAINLINNKDLRFTSLFILKTELEESNLLSNLNSRNQITFQFMNQILKKENSVDDQFSDHNQRLYIFLKWMLETGFNDDGLNDEFDEVLDIISALLIKEFKDMSILPIIAHLIFQRNKKGTLIHDLVWAFFQSQSPQSLTLIAERLISSHPKDVELAQRLLSFVSEINMNSNEDNQKQYLSFMNWLKENSPFLSFTGESFQQCSTPVPCTVRLDSKYLCRCTWITNTIRSDSLTYKEYKLLGIFNNLDDNTKALLSKFSFMLFSENPCFWHKWIQNPIEDQVYIAKTRIGGII